MLGRVLLLAAFTLLIVNPPFAVADGAGSGNSQKAREVLASLTHSSSVAVVLPADPSYGSRVPYPTYVSRDVMKCLTRLDRTFGVPQDQSYERLLSEDLDPELGIVTGTASEFHLSLDDVLFVEDYTDGYYFDPINSALRSGKIGGDACFIQGLEASLRKFPEYEGDAVRGTDLPAEVLAEHMPGRVVTYQAFTSATIGDDLSENFRDQPIVITIRSHHARDISELNDDEGEVIFMPGTSFRVISRENAINEDSGERTIRITMEEIPPGK